VTQQSLISRHLILLMTACFPDSISSLSKLKTLKSEDDSSPEERPDETAKVSRTKREVPAADEAAGRAEHRPWFEKREFDADLFHNKKAQLICSEKILLAL
jgi:hypothetical protein